VILSRLLENQHPGSPDSAFPDHRTESGHHQFSVSTARKGGRGAAAARRSPDRSLASDTGSRTQSLEHLEAARDLVAKASRPGSAALCGPGEGQSVSGTAGSHHSSGEGETIASSPRHTHLAQRLMSSAVSGRMGVPSPGLDVHLGMQGRGAIPACLLPRRGPLAMRRSSCCSPRRGNGRADGMTSARHRRCGTDERRWAPEEQGGQAGRGGLGRPFGSQQVNGHVWQPDGSSYPQARRRERATFGAGCQAVTGVSRRAARHILSPLFSGLSATLG
jgi:hypothetical protein